MSIKSVCISTLILFAIYLFASCHPQVKEAREETATEVQTPVTVISVKNDTLSDYIELNATSTFLQKSYPKANANGYLQAVDIHLGDYVNKGKVLFTIKTKESQSIGNIVNALDTSFVFSGINTIKASDQGYITQLNHHDGDYVQDGEQLAVISKMNSFVFLLNLPYELRPYLLRNSTLQLILPDGQILNGTVAASLPMVDSVSQTQSIVIRVNSPHPIPENLIAKVRIVKSYKTNTVAVPKSAVLTNETQTDFWVLKIIDSTTAVKVAIQKGIETNGKVEILSPKFKPNDQIVVTGNYGLGDTAKVKIVQD